MAVGGPKGRGGIFGAGKHGGLLGVKRAEPEVGAALIVDRGEGESFAVGRDNDWACVKAGGAKCGFRRWWDVGSHRKRGRADALREIEKDSCRDEQKTRAGQERCREDCAWRLDWCDVGWRLRGLQNTSQLQAHIVRGMKAVFAIFCQAGGNEIVEGWRRGGLGGGEGFRI